MHVPEQQQFVHMPVSMGTDSMVHHYSDHIHLGDTTELLGKELYTQINNLINYKNVKRYIFTTENSRIL